MNSALRPLIGITMGDAAGIGPEIILKSLSLKEMYDLCRPLVIGDVEVMVKDKNVGSFKSSLDIHSIRDVSKAMFKYGVVDVLDLSNVKLHDLTMGTPQSMAGKASYEYISKAVELASKGEIDAITTAPISKEAMHMAGYYYPGHTEILAELTETKDYAMMFIAGSLRVILVTIHVSLKEAVDLIDRGKVFNTIKLAHQTLLKLGIEEPRIAVAGLNPHAGEAGLFGEEEIREIKPAIDLAKELGINVTGPYPSDTIFFRANRGQFDIVVAMYHDQGCIPIKTLGFEIGVNMTVGLPIIRTSVDHGTAYGRAGKRLGTGDPRSLIEAIKMAVKLSSK